MRTTRYLHAITWAALGLVACAADDDDDDDGAAGDSSAAADDDADPSAGDDADPSAGDDADPSAGDDADPSAGDDADPSAGDDTTGAADEAGDTSGAADTGPGGALRIEGTVARDAAAAPFEGNDAIGDVYVVAFDDACGGNVVGNGMVVGADLSDPASAVPFTIEGVAPGMYFVTGFLDDNGDYDPADPGPNMGDIAMTQGAGPGCAEVEVVDADVTGVALVLNLALPFDPP